jgi:hypothetical protein
MSFAMALIVAATGLAFGQDETAKNAYLDT